jgi:choline dehydrogenase-like flavoprotein
MRKGIQKAVEIMFAAGARRVAFPTVENLAAQENFFDYFSRDSVTVFYNDEKSAKHAVEFLKFTPGQTTLTSAHMQATNQMGKVVDRDHKFIGLDNLYIVDSSVFPGSIGANPMQSIYTIAYIFSQWKEPSRISGNVPHELN